jgi:hypothetical protein
MPHSRARGHYGTMIFSTCVITYAQANLERETGIEPATFSLARRCSTTEPLPLNRETTQWSADTHDWVGGERLELSWLTPTDPKSALSTNFSNRP